MPSVYGGLATIETPAESGGTPPNTQPNTSGPRQWFFNDACPRFSSYVYIPVGINGAYPRISLTVSFFTVSILGLFLLNF